ncbi:hypothetical protein [Paenibacillus sp. P22]|uniref:hypothetical protein n=1 Tax=Paenibacillus sp. P22 TaxID=483908 RepID=UPI000430E161|nr:hypothetical protein [Paenibacillus sp. P22]CDN42954.1 hypothetical protein BN871_CF_00190 [Paenibacillus sp. P22]
MLTIERSSWPVYWRAEAVILILNLLKAKQQQAKSARHHDVWRSFHGLVATSATEVQGGIESRNSGFNSDRNDLAAFRMTFRLPE